MTDDWRVYECDQCGALEIGALLGTIDFGPKADEKCCPNCDAECTNLTPVRYRLVKVSEGVAP